MKKVLIANRGEIAVRIIRTCRDMGLSTVGVYSECDRSALHVRLADEACAIGPSRASDSYLRIDRLIEAARRTGADAVHPGYGFLAENPAFARACAAENLVFIGPEPATMEMMSSKTGARGAAERVGVLVVPGSPEALSRDVPDEDLVIAGAAIGYPLLVKAVEGGGGKGMRTVRTADELIGAVRLARSEALAAFGDDRIYFERLIERARHVEVQLLGDMHGTVVPFVERECSIQRRHQKLVEESPSPAVTPDLRERLTAAAARIGREAGYASAGTVEFLVDQSGGFYFLEMNTRLQVEHPVTEAVTGVDFVRAQIDIARGARLESIIPGLEEGREPRFRAARGHAIEVRVYAENPEEGFLPSPGTITHLAAPSGPGIRDDGGVFAGWTVPSEYDALISKVIAWAPDRAGAIARMVRALEEYDLRGIRTTIEFCRDVVASPDFAAGAFDTAFVDQALERWRADRLADLALDEIAAIAAALWKATRTAGAARRDAGGARSDSPWTRQARTESLR